MMGLKKFACSAMALFLYFLTIPMGYAQTGLVKITDRVYSYLDAQDPTPANSYGANRGIIIGDKGVAVIDTGISASAAKEFLADIRKITDKPILYVVNTHHHLDHTFGNTIFAAQGADIVAQEECAAAMRQSAGKTLANITTTGLTPDQIAGTKISYPNKTFGKRRQLDLGGISAELIYPGPSHSPGSILVYLSREKVIFAGDILFTDFHPYLGEADIKNWRQVLDFMATLNADKIIPGHGGLSQRRDLMEMASYITMYDVLAGEMAAQGKDADSIVEMLKKSLPPRTRGENLIRAGVVAKYLPEATKKQD